MRNLQETLDGSLPYMGDFCVQHNSSSLLASCERARINRVRFYNKVRSTRAKRLRYKMRRLVSVSGGLVKMSFKDLDDLTNSHALSNEAPRPLIAKTWWDLVLALQDKASHPAALGPTP